MNKYKMRAMPLVLGALTLGLITDQAVAATYEVATCRAPDGSPAETTDDGAGWKTRTSGWPNAHGGNIYANSCSSGGFMEAEVAASMSQGSPTYLAWEFGAPIGTSIVRYRIDLEGRVRTRADGLSTLGDFVVRTPQNSDPNYDERWPRSGDASNPIIPRAVIDHRTGNVNYVRVHLACYDPDQALKRDCEVKPTAATKVKIHQATFTLNDPDAPQVAQASGTALTSELWAVPVGISVNVSDSGSGVHRLGIEVDDSVAKWIPVNYSKCSIFPGTARTFTSPRPCPANSSISTTIDPASLPAGDHKIRIFVEDAAGNQTTIVSPTVKQIRHVDLGPLNGNPPSSQAVITAAWKGTGTSENLVRFGAPTKLAGRVTDISGTPIRNAQLRMSYEHSMRNPERIQDSSIPTDGEGRFELALPAGTSSRSIYLTYHRRLYDSTPVGSYRLTLRTRAGVAFNIDKKVAWKGSTVAISGRLLGYPLPAVRKVIEIQARAAGGKWITFKTTRTNSAGVFKTKYKFRQGGPIKYQMRARARKAFDYPFETGTSNKRSIRVR